MNIAEILKHCPKGTKLYSLVDGEVSLQNICNTGQYRIEVSVNDWTSTYFTEDGKLFANRLNGECILFPSKNQRDWSKFRVSDQATDQATDQVTDQKQETELKPFDKVLVRDFDDRKWVCDFFEGIPTSSEYEYSCVLRGLVHQCIPYEGNEHLLGTTNKPE